MHTVFPHIRPAGIIFFAGPSTSGIIRMRVLFEGWYYYYNFIDFDIKPRNPDIFIVKIMICVIKTKQSA